MLKFGHFVKYLINTWNVLKYGAGEGGDLLKRSCEKCYKCDEKSVRRGIFYRQSKEGSLAGLVTFCVETVL